MLPGVLLDRQLSFVALRKIGRMDDVSLIDCFPYAAKSVVSLC
jgi:hypothetical protein